MGRGSRSRIKRNKRLLKKIAAIAGIVAAIGTVFCLLALVVVSDNNGTCSAVGLKGGITGCKQDKRYVFDNIYFVVGNTSNTPAPYLSDTVLKYVRNSSLKKNPRIKLFSVANRETISFKNNIDINEEEETEDTLSRIKGVKDDLEASITAEPKTDGAQYYETIVRAGKAILSDSESNEKSIIIVIGSGLSDGGILNFSSGELLSLEAEEVVSLLENKNAIDEDSLKGVQILWTGVGLTSEPQAELSAPDKARVEDIYDSVLKASGVKKLDFDDGADENLQSISTSKVVKTTPTADECYFCTTREFGSEELGFAADSYEISNESKLLEISQRLETDMKNSNGKVVVVTGYRARAYCGDDRQLPLQMDRAKEVRNFIINHTSIGAEKVEAVDGGIGPNDECESSGVVDESIAIKNRIVKIKIER